MKFVRSSLLVKLVILIVVVYAVVTLVSLRNQIADKNAEAAALTSSITAVEQKNGKLEEAIATADSDEGVEAIARDKLGMVTDGEARWEGSWLLRDRPSWRTPKPSRIIPTARIRPKMKSLRLLITVNGSLAAKAVVVQQHSMSTRAA